MTTMRTMVGQVAKVGEVGLLECDGGLRVPVRVVDAKEAYGSMRFWVEPVGGDGRAWVDAGRVRATPAGADPELPTVDEVLDALASLTGAVSGTTCVLKESMPRSAAAIREAQDRAVALLGRVPGTMARARAAALAEVGMGDWRDRARWRAPMSIDHDKAKRAFELLREIVEEHGGTDTSCDWCGAVAPTIDGGRDYGPIPHAPSCSRGRADELLREIEASATA